MINATETVPALTEFLLARIAEDEADSDAIAKEIGRWGREQALNGVDGAQGSIVVTAVIGSAADPARLLAECEAKRRIVELHDRAHHQCVSIDEPTLWRTATNPCNTLRVLAAVYADHPDYRDEWKP